MPDEYVFPGFSKPNYTQVPDELFDELLPRLSEAELKVLLYVVRRTFGFKKDADTISLKQMVEGIKTKDGRQVDNGTGLSRPGVTKGVKGLVQKGVLIAARNRSEEKGDEPTTYQLRFLPVATMLTGGSQHRFDPLPHDVSSPPRNDVYPQETDVQETVGQDLSNLRKDQTTDYDEAREWLLPFVEDFAGEFRDTAPIASTLTRITRQFRRSGLDEERFTEILYRARQRTKERTAAVKSGEGGKKNLMPYYLAIVDDLIGDPGEDNPSSLTG